MRILKELFSYLVWSWKRVWKDSDHIPALVLFLMYSLMYGLGINERPEYLGGFVFAGATGFTIATISLNADGEPVFSLFWGIHITIVMCLGHVLGTGFTLLMEDVLGVTWYHGISLLVLAVGVFFSLNWAKELWELRKSLREYQSNPNQPTL